MANFNLAELFMDTDHADIIFVVDKKEIPGHRVVLAKTCPYFDKLLFGHFLESKSTRVVINGTSAMIFEEVMRFVYKGVLEVDQWTIENVLSLLAVAHEYQFLPLFSSVIKVLELKPLDLYSWALVNSSASVYDSAELRRICTGFSDEKIVEFIHRRDLERYSAEFICSMMDSPKMSTCNQDDFLGALFEWRLGHSSAEILSLLQKIHWNKVSPDITAILVKEFFSTVKNVHDCQFWTKCTPMLEKVARVDSIVLSRECPKRFDLPNNKGSVSCHLYSTRLRFRFHKNNTYVELPVRKIEFETSNNLSIEEYNACKLYGPYLEMVPSEPSLNNEWFKYSAVFSDTKSVYAVGIVSEHLNEIPEIKLRNFVIS